MNVNKYFSFAIVVFLMAVPLVLTSCGKDNILDDVEELQPELKVWTEPYHVEGSTIDEVKNYMDFSMKRDGLYRRQQYPVLFSSLTKRSMVMRASYIAFTLQMGHCIR